MRRIARVILLGLGTIVGPAQAQQSITGVPPLRLEVTVEQAQLIVQTLGAIGCQTVTQLIVCEQAKELLSAIREQVKAQQK